MNTKVFSIIVLFHFSKKKSQIDQLLQNHAEKRRLSAEYGITLIEIPYQYTYKNKGELFEFIMKELEETGFAVSLGDMCLIKQKIKMKNINQSWLI